MEVGVKLGATNLESSLLTHSRLKRMSSEAQSSEDHVSRLAMALSIAEGAVGPDWAASRLNGELDLFSVVSGKQIRGKTLFKDDLPLWMALVLRHQKPEDYSEWRKTMHGHWERGVQILMGKFLEEKDWLRTLNSCIPR